MRNDAHRLHVGNSGPPAHNPRDSPGRSGGERENTPWLPVRAGGELGIGVVIYEPLASGILSDKTLEQVLAMRPIAARPGVTVAQLAVAWVLHQPGVISATAGSRDGRHVRENAEASKLDLTGSLDELDALIPLGPRPPEDRLRP